MRVNQKEIKDREVIRGLLSKGRIGRLGTSGQDGYPRIKMTDKKDLGTGGPVDFAGGQGIASGCLHHLALKKDDKGKRGEIDK